jgi:hypothetical protein
MPVDESLRAFEREHKAKPNDQRALVALWTARGRAGLCGWCGGAPTQAVAFLTDHRRGRKGLICPYSGAPVCDPCASVQRDDGDLRLDDGDLRLDVLAAIYPLKEVPAPARPTWAEHVRGLIANVLAVTKGWPEKARSRALRLVKPREYQLTSHGRQTWSKEVRRQLGTLPATPRAARKRNEAIHDKTAALFPEVTT